MCTVNLEKNWGVQRVTLKSCQYVWRTEPKPSLKIRTANAICWNTLGLFRDYGLNLIFLGIKLFLFFKIESWNFQVQFEIEFRETLQNFNSIRQPIENMETTIVWMSPMSSNFVRFHEILFQTDAMLKQLSILKNKKSFIPKKLFFKPFKNM